MPQLIVQTDRLPYGKRTYLRGEEFEASEKDAKLLVGIKKARLSETYGSGPTDLPAEVMTRAVKAEEPAPVVTEVVEDEAPKSQTYLRRDMVAETPSQKAPGRRGRPKKSQ